MASSVVRVSVVELRGISNGVDTGARAVVVDKGAGADKSLLTGGLDAAALVRGLLRVKYVDIG
jgi:hypothetical protein